MQIWAGRMAGQVFISTYWIAPRYVSCSVMRIRELRWLFVTITAVALFLSAISDPHAMGIAQEWTNDSYRFAGGTHPVALAISLVVLALYFLLMFGPPTELGEPMPGVFRRFVTFWLDFIIFMMLAAPIAGILPTITEWKRTGKFSWSFERTVRAPSDGWVVAAGAVLVVSSLVFYFSFPLIRHKPSPGSCITGYQIVSDEGSRMTTRTAVFRTLLGFIAACAAYVAPFVFRDRKKGKFWLDAVFGTRALKLR